MKKPLNPQRRVIFPDGGNVFIDGYKDLVTYSDNTKYTQAKAETLSEFIAAQSRILNRSLWFTKHIRFREETEFRVIFYACNKRGETAELYTTTDDYLILSADLTGIVSKEPIAIS
jgi:hypothetical protein